MSDNGDQEPIEQLCPFWQKKCSEVNAEDVPEEKRCAFLAPVKGQIMSPLGVAKPTETKMCLFQLIFNIQSQLLNTCNMPPAHQVPIDKMFGR